MRVDVHTMGLNQKEMCIFFLECPKYTQQRDKLFKQLNDISVPFHNN